MVVCLREWCFAGAMAIALGATAMIIGSTLFLGSVLVTAFAAPDERIPMGSNPRVRRGANIGLRVAGFVLTYLGSTWGLVPAVGVWFILPLVVAFIPGLAAIPLHNAGVARRAAANEPGPEGSQTP
jgi:uncharacterized membrane protein (DUF485 family)